MTGSDRLPGDPTPRQTIERILRVDHAGEYGAMRIYEGQLAVLGEGRHGSVLRHMAEQERLYRGPLSATSSRAGPSDSDPADLARRRLRARRATALMGERAAMACIVAVEEHYADQKNGVSDPVPPYPTGSPGLPGEHLMAQG